MSKAEQAVRKKHLVRTHIRAALASIRVIAENCDPQDYKYASEARTMIEIIRMELQRN